MSHPSKVEEIRDALKCGYKIYLYFVCTDSPDVNVSRVENRVAKGGHNVEATKIQSRYYLTLHNLINAIESSNKCYLFDNSQDRFILIAKVFNNSLQIMVEPEELPNWFVQHVLKYYS